MPKDSLMNKVMNIQAHKSGTWKWAERTLRKRIMRRWMSGKQTIDNLKSFCGFPTNVIKKKCENIDQFFFTIGFVITDLKAYHYITIWSCPKNFIHQT